MKNNWNTSHTILLNVFRMKCWSLVDPSVLWENILWWCESRNGFCHMTVWMTQCMRWMEQTESSEFTFTKTFYSHRYSLRLIFCAIPCFSALDYFFIFKCIIMICIPTLYIRFMCTLPYWLCFSFYLESRHGRFSPLLSSLPSQQTLLHSFPLHTCDNPIINPSLHFHNNFFTFNLPSSAWVSW